MKCDSLHGFRDTHILEIIIFSACAMADILGGMLVCCQTHS